MQNRLLISFILFFSVAVVFAQQADLVKLKLYYDDLEYEKTIEQSELLLHNHSRLSLRELAEVHKYLALSYFALGKEDSSAVHFSHLLAIQPQFRLDPVEYSPKIITFVEEIRGHLRALQKQKTGQASFTNRYFIADDPRPAASWRSAVFPGWGQFYKGQKSRAYVYSSAFVLSGGMLAFSWVKEKQSYDAYIKAVDTDMIKEKYKSYNQWYRIRKNTTITTIAVWLVSFVDALAFLPDNIQFVPADQQGLQINFKF